MAAHKRTKDERERDLARLSEQYLRGVPQWKIAEMFGVSQQQVSRDLRELRRRWLQSSQANMDELIARELAKIDNLEAENWTAWERSFGEHRKDTVKFVGSPPGDVEDGDRPGTEKVATERKTVTEELAGDPRFLQGIDRCIERRCKLLGLEAPAKIAPTDPTGKREYQGGGLSALLEQARLVTRDGGEEAA